MIADVDDLAALGHLDAFFGAEAIRDEDQRGHTGARP
jgi:hypothetical protein